MTTPQSIPQSILARIRKLSAMTEANGCTEAEAIAAAAAYVRLIDQWQPTADELRAESRKCATDELVTFDQFTSDWSHLVAQSGKLYGCRVWQKTSYDDPLGLGVDQVTTTFKFFGLPLDIGTARGTLATLYTAIQSETSRWIATSAKQPGKRLTQSAKTQLMRSFRRGMADRLYAALGNLTAQRNHGMATTGSSLVVLKDQLVTEEFAKLGLSLGHGRRGRSTPMDSRAYAAGQRAGANVNVGGANNITRAPLALSGRA